jgi:hypothetical protein
MPYERHVERKVYYWCPKWYWPFAVCSKTRRVHEWCYQFRWYKETGFVFVKHCEGCEGEMRYSWWKPCLFCLGSNYWQDPTLAFFEMCFTTPRGSAGTCAG